MLFGALSRLARQGTTALPYESLDLIHSFFVDEWASVVRNYRPDRGALRVYLYSAFVRYARRVILRERRLRGELLDETALASYLEQPHSGASDPETRLDVDAVNAILRALPEAERNVLTEYLDGASERELADRYRVSRYRIRETLAATIVRVAMQLERPVFIGQREWEVTRSIIGGGRTVKQAADRLGVSEEWARSVHRDTLRSLLARIRTMST